MSAETVIRRVARDVDRRGRRSPAAPRLLAGIFCGLLAGAAANANPVEPTVTHGNAQFARPDANTLDVTTSSNAIINWRSFSIGAGETTRFTQPSASSAVLNRVTGTDSSSILGQLLSNGRVFLVNPHGIVFGEDAVVDTAGLVASTLGITDEDFLAGRYEFDAGPDAGDITNRGLITSGTDGVFLLAPGIENSGVVRTAGGDLVLAAGSTITLTSLDLDGVQVEVQAPDDEALNLGELIAERGAAGVFAGSIRNSGTVEANAVTVDENGVIRLVARNDIILEAEGKVAAEGPSGGEIRIESGSGTTSVSGDVSVRASEGAGGTIRLLGDRVGLDGATVDASGPAGGGEVLVGGDERGEGTVPTAESTYVSSDSTVSADALDRRRRRQGGGVRGGVCERAGPFERPGRPRGRRRRLCRDLGPEVAGDCADARHHGAEGRGRGMAHRPERHRDRARWRRGQHRRRRSVHQHRRQRAARHRPHHRRALGRPDRDRADHRERREQPERRYHPGRGARRRADDRHQHADPGRSPPHHHRRGDLRRGGRIGAPSGAGCRRGGGGIRRRDAPRRVVADARQRRRGDRQGRSGDVGRSHLAHGQPGSRDRLGRAGAGARDGYGGRAGTERSSMRPTGRSASAKSSPVRGPPEPSPSRAVPT